MRRVGHTNKTSRRRRMEGYRHDTLGGCEESACQGVLDDIIFVPKTAAQGDWAVKQGVDGRAELDGGIPDFQNGLVRRMRRLSTEEVLDGLSSTYMIGEKYVPPESYDKGDDKGDKYPAWSGYSVSNIRWGHDKPLRDKKRSASTECFRLSARRWLSIWRLLTGQCRPLLLTLILRCTKLGAPFSILIELYLT